MAQPRPGEQVAGGERSKLLQTQPLEVLGASLEASGLMVLVAMSGGIDSATAAARAVDVATR
jgi:PP-loop superfamily ATP-utilizing enzyme